jgi:hypothetical protein
LQYLSIADVALSRTTCKLWRAEYAPNKSLLWLRLRPSSYSHSPVELKSVGDLAWMLDGMIIIHSLSPLCFEVFITCRSYIPLSIIGARATEHFPAATLPPSLIATGLVWPPLPTAVTTTDTTTTTTTTNTAASSYEEAKLRDQQSLNANAPRSRHRLLMVKTLHDWIKSLPTSPLTKDPTTELGPLMGHVCYLIMAVSRVFFIFPAPFILWMHGG